MTILMLSLISCNFILTILSVYLIREKITADIKEQGEKTQTDINALLLEIEQAKNDLKSSKKNIYSSLSSTYDALQQEIISAKTTNKGQSNDVS